MYHVTSKSRLGIVSALTLSLTVLGHAQGRGGGTHAGSFNSGGFAGAGNRPSSNLPAPVTRPNPMPPAQAQRGWDTSAEHRAAAPAALQLAAAMKDINQTSFEARMQLLKNADMSLQANRDALKKIQEDARKLRGDAREKFQAALDAVKTKEAALGNDIAAARNTDTAGWQKSREKVATAYQHYLDALARLEAVRKNGEPPPKH